MTGRGREPGGKQQGPEERDSCRENDLQTGPASFHDCAKCGACSVVCPVYRVDGRESMTARGKMFLLASGLAGHPSPVFENLFARCLLCSACEQVCPRHLPITDILSRARSRFSLFYGRAGLQKVAAREVLARPGLLEKLVKAGIGLKRLKSLPAGSGLRLRLGLLEERVPVDKEAITTETIERDPQGLTYFSGCLARHLQPSVAAATHQLLDHCGGKASEPADQCCCGLAAWSAGRRDQARALARRNIEAFAGSSGPIITSCASCSSHLLAYPQLFAGDEHWQERARAFAERVREFSSFFTTLLPAIPQEEKPGRKIFYHDPCHLRFQDSGTTSPRSLLRKQGFQLAEPEDGPACCGQGGLFHLAYPQTSAAIFKTSADRALSLAPECITTTCSGCLMQYQQGMVQRQDGVPVIHMALLLAQGPGGQERK